ncbi:hypothetical protein [Roseivirga pacifica]|uniref:hypothetical protein n=1 Tax=Roseivirga pacifica TaxID=1267423 RepID=UPI002095DF0F|nr:hypothetical protein [Roseivirga pacifica]MCO6358760.1 hypothetical protein [Roseivirga pacifica]MCO6365604.1 hypothetical protein [Roseivirga pacifica]MCO6371666.1 hypothetical protein [Roseivirga pacifica]MCO6376223.1 hypothetical protein [Roseivirga pacifica]MCO6379044.1 hypothetical protein [Roseivirga pacifica]
MPNTTSSNALIVPIQINSLYLESDQTVMDAKADFSRVPWSNGQEDFNADTPFLGESVLSPPFQNKNFTMGAGVHLHWVLPRAFRTYPTTQDSSGAKKDPYPAPNRWLIKNTQTGNEWVVESDYMNTEITAYNKDAVTVPVIASELPGSDPKPQPYRYLGRQVLRKNWPTTEPDPNASYWSDEHGGKELTAFGYGEMAFNTFYPNCRSVFGFFDPNPGDMTNGVTYEVMGWYASGEAADADISNDIVNKAVTELNSLINDPAGNLALLRKMFDGGKNPPPWLSGILSSHPDNPPWGDHIVTTKKYKNLLSLLLDSTLTKPVSLSDVLNLATDGKQNFITFGLKQMLNWDLNTTSTNIDTNTRSLYYGTITVNSGNTPITFDNVAVGNSASEALSAYLGQELSPGTEDIGLVEDQLNAILHGGNFQGNLTDAKLNFKEAVHASGFEPKQSGTLWRVRKMQLPETGASPVPQPTKQGQGGQVTLPDDFAGLLNNLNLAQSEYDKGREDIESLQNEIYASWSKYMMVAYPPLGTHMDLPDQDFVKAYVEWQCTELQIMQQRVGTFVAGGTADKPTGLLGTNLSNAYQAVMDYLNNPQTGHQNSINEKAKAEGYEYELSVVPAPRYYKPKDPVLVFTSSDAAPAAADTKAPLPVLWADQLGLASSGIPASFSVISGKTKSSCIDQFTSHQQKSLPQILEWWVDYYPFQNGNNLTTGSGDYDPDFLGTSNFGFQYDEFDFERSEDINDSPNSYTGSTYIATNPEAHVLDSLKTFLLGRYSELSKDDFKLTGDLASAWSNLIKIKKAKKEKSIPTDYSDPGYTAYMAYTKLSGKHFIAQSIGGFNQALIQFMQNIQLPILDPLKFSDYDNFVAKVKSALQNVNPPSSDPNNIFVPLRAGALNLKAAQLVDHFGRGTGPTTLTPPYIAKSLSLTINKAWWWMGPRFSLETRLNFRWLAADAPTGDTDIEMNSHPASSPVCGWILPNYLDNSLVFYNQDGKGLGSIHQEDGKWHHFPGSVNPISITTATTSAPAGVNNHLFKVIHRLLNWAGNSNSMTPNPVPTESFMQNLISNIENAQNAIYPENYAGHEALSILVGKPIAIVRATINLEAKGGIIADKGWIPFGNQLQGATPQTDGYEHVEVPINLGDPHQLNDGLIAYWKEDDTGSLESSLTVITSDKQTTTIQQTLASKPVNLTMLVDPHGVVHATSGVLPVKVIDIPPDQYTKALKNIEVAFFSAPLLTPTTNIQLSTPKESGYQWTWLQQNLGTGSTTTWQHTPDVPLVSENDLNNSWNDLVSSESIYPLPTNTLMDELSTQKWLGNNAYPGTDFYQVMLPDKRQPLGDTWKDYQTQIEEIIFKNLRGVVPYNTNAQFQNQHLLEGWLLLSNDQGTDAQPDNPGA